MKGLLAGSRCVVIGATGNIGRGAAHAFLEHGAASVALVGRDRARLQDLADGYLDSDSRIVLVPVDMSGPEGALESANLIGGSLGGIDHLVSSSGPWWNAGPLGRLDYELWRRAFRANVDTHFQVWRHLASLMTRGASYVLVNGEAAHSLPQSGLTGVCANAVAGLAEVVAAEAAEQGIRAHQLMIGVRVADGPPQPGVPSARFGGVFAAIASGRTGHEAGSTIAIPNEKTIEDIAGVLTGAQQL